MFKKLLYISICISCLLYSTGCSVNMALKQPEKKDVSLFRSGIPRNMLLIEFGNPIASEVREDGKNYDIFAFTQGYSDGARAGRAIFHGLADIITLGMWEAVATPTETALDGKEMAYEVRYDENNLIDQVVLLMKK